MHQSYKQSLQKELKEVEQALRLEVEVEPEQKPHEQYHDDEDEYYEEKPPIITDKTYIARALAQSIEDERMSLLRRRKAIQRELAQLPVPMEE